MSALDPISGFIGEGSFLRNAIIGVVVIVILMVILYFVISSGYFIFAVLLGIIAVLGLIAYLMYAELKKHKTMDAMTQGFLQLYRSTQAFNIPLKVPLLTSLSSSSTLTGTLGTIIGRTMLPPDKELLNYMSSSKLKDGKTDIIWVVRVNPKSKELPKNILCLFADSQVSHLSRDFTGDWEIGMPVLVYGHWLKFGKFFVCVDAEHGFDVGLAGAVTSAVMAVLEKYVNRLSQLAVMDAKTKPSIVEAKALRKKEAEIIEQ